MLTWAGIMAFILAALTYLVSDSATLWLNLAELGGVIALFALVCAAEAFN
jgi:hypothetical protein